MNTMSLITNEEALELIQKRERRFPTRAFIDEHLKNKAARIASGRKLSGLSHREIWEEFLPLAGADSFFNLVLDTTGPGGATAVINGGAAYAINQIVTFTLNTTDSPTTGYEILIWGDVDGTYNGSIQPLEVNSAWIPAGTYPVGQAVKLSAGDGSKTLYAKIRDDVWNETAQLSDSITLDLTVPVVTIQIAPDTTKVSTVSGKTTCVFSWDADTIFDEYEVAVVANSGSLRGSGTVIPTTAGSVNTSGTAGGYPAATNIQTTLKGTDIQTASAGDGTKVIKVFVKDAAGNWSTA